MIGSIERDASIVDVEAREILDSRGNPTVECDVRLASGAVGRAAVPSGASTGEHEALELRDGGDRYAGRGVLEAVANVCNRIGPELEGVEATEQRTIDRMMIELDGTDNKRELGANAMLGVSLAAARASARHLGIPLYRYLGGADSCTLPVPMMNILNGGDHADNDVDFQEFMVVPVGAQTMVEAVRHGAEIFHALQDVLSERDLRTTVGDEGGFAPDLGSNREALELVAESVEAAGYDVGGDIWFALDVAASELVDESGAYRLDGEGRRLESGGLVDLYAELAEDYPLASLEDGLAEDDWAGWRTMTDRLGDEMQLVGDDLFATNTTRLNRGIDSSIANALLVKVNQIGTLTETFDAVQTAHRAGYRTIVSHRSGETEDTTIASLAVGVESGQIKTGSLSRSDRVAKYNELLRIEEQLGASAVYPGREAIPAYDEGK